MYRPSFAMLRAAALFLAACVAPVAQAICFPELRRVGDTASDSACTDNDIQSAIDAVSTNNPSCPAVVGITREHIWGDQHLAIADKTLQLVGFGDGVTCSQVNGLDICGQFGSCPTAPLVTLNGSGGGRVLLISGASNVTLRFLTITGGNTGGYGGGIAYDGSGTLAIDTSTINLNHASRGGGISFHGSTSAAALRLYANSLILANTADSYGGGIYLSGGARLFATSPQTWIALNHATAASGGGLSIVESARADIGSPGYNGAGVIGYNDAVNGGGAALEPGDYGGTLRLFTVDPAHPVQIDNNTASANGGAVYVGSGAVSPGVFCAFDFRLKDNAAADGAAIYAASHSSLSYPDSGGGVYFNLGPSDDASCGPESPPALGAVDCAADVPCSEISGNTAVDEFAQPTGGAVIRLTSAATLVGDPFALRGNAGAELVRASGSNAEFFSFDVFMRNCLIAGNHTQRELIGIHDGRDLFMNGCTVAGNTIDNGYQVYGDFGGAGLRLLNSIFDQPGVSVLDYNGDNALRTLSYLIANETFTLGGADHTQGDTPIYVDAANGDYHLAWNSPGVDYAPSQAGSDLDGKPRTVDLAPVVNLYGPRDLGAYERQSAFDCDAQADAIFCSSFDS